MALGSRAEWSQSVRDRPSTGTRPDPLRRAQSPRNPLVPSKCHNCSGVKRSPSVVLSPRPASIAIWFALVWPLSKAKFNRRRGPKAAWPPPGILLLETRRRPSLIRGIRKWVSLKAADCRCVPRALLDRPPGARGGLSAWLTPEEKGRSPAGAG